MEKINLASKLAQFQDHWRPRTVARLNEYDVMLVKVRGEFVWHKHDETDDFFLVIEGNLEIRLRDRTVRLAPGELFVVPRGVEPVLRRAVRVVRAPTPTPRQPNFFERLFGGGRRPPPQPAPTPVRRRF